MEVDTYGKDKACSQTYILLLYKKEWITERI